LGEVMENVRFVNGVRKDEVVHTFRHTHISHALNR